MKKYQNIEIINFKENTKVTLYGCKILEKWVILILLI